jgi:diguanylate cyclase (GGDEF)-like protein/PAS domain S-box-containing protein
MIAWRRTTSHWWMAYVTVPAKAQQTAAPSTDTRIERLIGANQRLQSEIAARLNLGAEWQPDVLFRAMIDTVPDYLFVKDRDSRFVVANRAVAADLGASPEDIIGKTDFDLHPLERARKFYADEQHVISTGRPLIDIEEFIIDSAGHRKFLLTTKVPLCNSGNEIVGIVGISRDVTARKAAEEEVQFLARHDPLTRLPNRSLLMERLRDAIARAAGGQRVAVAFIDLDGFKEVNDRYGHDVGDRLLRTVAARMLACVRSTDTIARLGGDEFVMVLADQRGAPASTPIIDKARAAIAAPIRIDDLSIEVSCSIGVAICPDDGSDPEALLRAADAAMYRAKVPGRR